MLALDKEDGHAVGIYALNHVVDRDVWTLSYVNRFDDWGKGYTTEGMKALWITQSKSTEHAPSKVNVLKKTSAAPRCCKNSEWYTIIVHHVQRTTEVLRLNLMFMSLTLKNDNVTELRETGGEYGFRQNF